MLWEEKRCFFHTEPCIEKKKTEFLGVYSPLGRCLQTSFAWTLAQILSEERAVLYLNMEEYSDLKN